MHLLVLIHNPSPLFITFIVSALLGSSRDPFRTVPLLAFMLTYLSSRHLYAFYAATHKCPQTSCKGGQSTKDTWLVVWTQIHQGW